MSSLYFLFPPLGQLLYIVLCCCNSNQRPESVLTYAAIKIAINNLNLVYLFETKMRPKNGRFFFWDFIENCNVEMVRFMRFLNEYFKRKVFLFSIQLNFLKLSVEFHVKTTRTKKIFLLIWKCLAVPRPRGSIYFLLNNQFFSRTSRPNV